MVRCCECLEYNQCPDLSEHRNKISSFLSGLFFFIGWWILIDAAANSPFKNNNYHIPGVISTIAMIMVNCVSNAAVRGDVDAGCLGQTGVRLWTMLSFLLAFGGLIGACYILFGEYVAKDESNAYPGVAGFLQNVFIFLVQLFLSSVVPRMTFDACWTWVFDQRNTKDDVLRRSLHPHVITRELVFRVIARYNKIIINFIKTEVFKNEIFLSLYS